MAKKKILVTGANGQLGSAIQSIRDSYNSFDFLFAGRDQLAVDSYSSVENCFRSFKPDYVINTAAYTAVDKAETERDAAETINVTAVGLLAAAAVKYNAQLIHISTDYVFNGNSEKPYTEEDATDPIGFYGATKLAGEEAALFTDEQAIVIRTAWVYSSFGNNFYKTMKRLMSEKSEISVVNDQIGAPTNAVDLARAILDIIASGKWEPGIYHYSNSGKISWYDFAVAIRDQISSTCVINAISSSAYPTPAKRPSFSLLDTGKIVKTYQVKVPGWKESLAGVEQTSKL
ncbi:MAG: dTDP-4-dehydrorhamnose reductase [Chitinophagaceae bacterium]|nr:MAG: dTDP-4-dehydrorhamnose reductase [Chitinophagaceae bacterium]